MTKAKNTPGPWIVKQTSSGNPFVYEGATGKTVAGVALVKKDCDREESEANARLIAAAPELLAALERTADVLEYYNENKGPTRDSALCDLFAIARAAIAKARGTD